MFEFASHGRAQRRDDARKAHSKTDFNEDLLKLDVPTLIIHDEDDHSLPIDVSARVSAKPVRDAVVKAYHGSADGLARTRRDQFNADLADIVKV